MERSAAPAAENTCRQMEPLFLSWHLRLQGRSISRALHEVYIPRIQQGNASFAANVLGAGGALLSVLVHFFEHGRLGSPVQTGVDGQSLTAEDQLFILMQAALCLSVTRGLGAPEAGICYERAESMCHSLNHPHLLYSALMGRFRYSLNTEKLTTTMQIVQRIYSLAQEQNDAALIAGACRALAGTLYFVGDFEAARQYAMRGVEIGALEPYGLMRRTSMCPRSFVFPMRPYPSGISERLPLPTRRSRKQSRWRKG